jgi:GT2 family glycosyltransferase
MNFPFPERTRVGRAIDGAERGLMPVRFATWVSLLVDSGAVERHGLPHKHFFIWSDDVEYTSRVLLGGELGYIVPSSVALHDTATAHRAETAAPDRFYYHVRNTLFMARDPRRTWRDRTVRGWVLLSSGVQYVLRNPDRAHASAVMRGLRDGLRTP